MGNKYDNYIKLIDINLGWTNYFQLHEHNIPEFKTNSIIILDHDVLSKLNIKEHEHQSNYFRSNENDVSNILFLPVDVERGFYEMLKNRENYIIFEQLTHLQYDVCFRDYYIVDDSDKFFYKHWYSSVLMMIKNNDTAFYITWKKLHEEEYMDFITSFKKAYNILANNLDLDEIDD